MIVYLIEYWLIMVRGWLQTVTHALCRFIKKKTK